MRELVVLLVSLILSGCADFAALRNCEKSGQAYFAGIPLASRSEHEQAQTLRPSNLGNCLLYVVREKDWWTGASVRRATVVLDPKEHKQPALLTESSELEPLHSDQLVEIYDEVYAMWELPPNTYSLKTAFTRSLGTAQDRALALQVLQDQPSQNAIQQVDIDCQPGSVLFFAVSDRGFSNHIMLKRLTEEVGKAYIPNGIRSVGFSNGYDKIESLYKDCPEERRR
jgi:hypothetical protein